MLGESSLDDADKAHLKFAERYEKEFLSQGETVERTIVESLDLGWKLLKDLPKESLKRVKPEMINKYMRD